jgi:hypothetical protein
MNLPIAKRHLDQNTMLAVVMGTLAMVRAWVVIHPSRHAGFTGSLALIVFEVIKTAVLLVVLGRAFALNSKEDDPLARAAHVRSFAMAAGMSVLIDTGITLFKL